MVVIPPGPDVRPFWIGRVPVTNREYAAFLEAGGAPPPPWFDQPGFREPFQPVVGVTWDESAGYCAWIAGEAGGTWRLPDEAEWEHAMSGGLPGAPTPWGDRLPAGEVPEGPLSGPWETGRGTPNVFGVLDPGTMVHEWCSNWREPGEGATPGGPRRASRGGSWRHAIRWSAPSARSSLPPAFRYSDYGFRVLRESPR
jgi:formylglycine-generating enzyme required for sulfatase activity